MSQAAKKLSGKEKMKRVRSMQEFKESCQVAFQQYEKCMEFKNASIQGSGTGCDLEEQKPLMDSQMQQLSTKALKNQQK